MAEEPRKQALQPLLEACCRSVQESLHSLVGGKTIDVAPGGLCATTPEAVASRLRAQAAIVRAALEKDDAGKILRFVFEAAEATTLAAAMTATADHDLAQKRAKGTLEGDDLQAFAEVANVLCAGVDGVLRQQFDSRVGLRLQDHATLAPGAADTSVLGDEPLVEIAMQIGVHTFPPSAASILLDRGTAERWNGGPVQLANDAAMAAAGADAAEDDGPAAPVRGRLAAFLLDGQTTPVLRRVCRRVGLELDRRPRGDVPNPAGLKDAVVFIEVAPTEERRFEWCRRVKTFRSQTRVVLLLLVPSRHHVLQAARAGADVVLGHPVSTQLLTQKLGVLLEPAPDGSPLTTP